MNKLLYDQYRIIFQFCDIITIKNYRMTNKYHDQISFRYLLDNYFFRYDVKMSVKYIKIINIIIKDLNEII